jgi:4-aminobutyrate aminotransferase-like enzyme
MPIAATILRPEVVEEFGRDMRYFNTFGGNAVSVAAAQAVLDIVREERLQENAATVGAELRGMLDELASRHASIGDVRGAGLFLGVELVVPGTDREPDEDLTLRVVNGLRARRVLLGTAGLDNNVLKVRPPLVFSRTDAERLVTELDATLTELGG